MSNVAWLVIVINEWGVKNSRKYYVSCPSADVAKCMHLVRQIKGMREGANWGVVSVTELFHGAAAGSSIDADSGAHQQQGLQHESHAEPVLRFSCLPDLLDCALL